MSTQQMSKCLEELRKANLPVLPRTCELCGFGPCRNKLSPPKPDMTPEVLADKLLRAAGSGLRHYTTRSREDILQAAREIMTELGK